MSAFRHEQQMVAVASARTAADAELLKMTLVAHGIEAVVGPATAGHPSVDFVEGLSISVRQADEAAARALLEQLGASGPGQQ